MQRAIVGVAAALLMAAVAEEPPVIQPKDLAARLQTKGAQPVMLYVGFAVLYRHKHIPSSIYVGPASRAEGLSALKTAAAGLPRDVEVILYCGCCPYDQCPNVKPATALLKKMGFTRVKTLMIPTNFAADWIDHGYPVEAGSALPK